jgi:hypothetical protein
VPGLLIVAAVLAVVVAFVLLGARRRALEDLRARWGAPRFREHRMDAIAASHESRMTALETHDAIDIRTWNDLLLDDVFVGIDRTESTLGQHALYHRLRTTPSDAQRTAFGALVDRFDRDSGARERAQLALGRLQDPHGYDLWWMARPAAVETPAWYVLFPVLVAVIAILLALAPWVPAVRAWVVVALVVNLVGGFTILRRASAATGAFRQLAPVIATAQALHFLAGDDIDPLVAPIRRSTPELLRLKTISRWVSGDPFMLSMSPHPLVVAAADLVNVVYDYVNFVVPLTAAGLYFGAADLRARGRALLEVLVAIGDVDAAVSVAALRRSRPEWTRPEFLPAGSPAVIVDARHPLLEDAVPNSITLAPGEGVLVTGSNMSGKSTFLRTVGVAAVLAQALDTTCAAEYRAPVFRVRSCLGRADDLLSGKSYYVVEVESLLSLVASSEDTAPHLFLLDELFRGTNAVERIAAGQSVLTELIVGEGGPKPHVALAATHDNELVDLLAGSYRACHFGDAVDETGLTFDHRLKPGRATSRNAIARLRLHGGSPALVERALSSAAELDRQRNRQRGDG